MRRWLCAGVLLAGTLTARAAEGRFSSTVRREDFAAAGLAKLSPEELARLDQLVRDYRAGAVEAVRQAPRPAAARPGLLERTKVLLTPGTRIEYRTLDSRLVGDFAGWERNTVFRLANGQRWRATGQTSYVTPPRPAPAVRIIPGALGAFWLEIEGVRQRVKVELLDAR